MYKNYYKDLTAENVLHGNFKRHIQCSECKGFYPMDVFHSGLCDGCALEHLEEWQKEDFEPNGIPF